MRLVTRSASLNFERGVLEGKRAAQVGMTLITVWFICRDRLDLPRQETAVRIVAVRAGHCALGQLVCEGFLESRPNVVVAARTHLIYFRVFPRIKIVESFMNGVTGRAGH